MIILRKPSVFIVVEMVEFSDVGYADFYSSNGVDWEFSSYNTTCPGNSASNSCSITLSEVLLKSCVCRFFVGMTAMAINSSVNIFQCFCCYFFFFIFFIIFFLLMQLASRDSIAFIRSILSALRYLTKYGQSKGEKEV